MSNIQELHCQAMNLAEQADLAKLRGDEKTAQKVLQQALNLEMEAAQIVADNLDSEPTRSVLHRSAASLAVECGKFQIAEKLIARALAGTPPLDIEEELKDLFMQINLSNYLNRQGIKLTETQLQTLTVR